MPYLLRFLLIVIIIGYSFSSKSQEIRDSLLSIVNSTEKLDTSFINAEREFVYYYMDRNEFDSAALFANKEREHAELIRWKKGQISARLDYAVILSQSGDYISALEKLYDALKIAENDRPESISPIYALIASLYSRLQNYPEAIRCLKTSLQLGNSIIVNHPDIYSNLGDNFSKNNQLDSALKYQDIAYRISQQANNQRWLTHSFCNLGNIYSKLSDLVKSNYYYALALSSPYINKLDNVETSTLKFEACIGLSKNYKILRLNDSVYYYAQKASYFSSKIPDFTNSIESIKVLVDLFKMKRNTDSIVKYQTALLVLQDSAKLLQRDKKMEEITINETYRQTEKRIVQLKQKKIRQNNIQLSIIGFFIPFFSALVYLIGKKRKRNSKIILGLGIVSLLMLFEFISLLVHPSVEKITNHNSILMFISLLLIASILVPLHHKLERFVKEKLS